MSIKMISQVSELDFKNQHVLKYVLFAMANYANSDDEAWPSYPTIAKFCSISERTAMRSVQKLVELGYLIKTNRTHSNGRDTSNLYKFNIVGVTNRQGEGDSVTPQRVTISHSSKENHKKEPLNESIGHSENDQDCDNLFSIFWKAFPKKVKKRNAFQVWVSKKLWRYSEDIMANIEQRKRVQKNWVSCLAQQKEFIPAPDVYLRNKGWEDELEVSHKNCKCQTNNNIKTHSSNEFMVR